MPRGRPRKDSLKIEKPVYIDTTKTTASTWANMQRKEYWRMKYKYITNRPVRSAMVVVATIMLLLLLF